MGKKAIFGENDPARRRAAIDEIFTEDCVFYDAGKGVYPGRDEIIGSRARSGLLTLTYDIRQLPRPRNWAMAGGSDGYRAALVRRQRTPGLISSLPGTAGLPPFISFSTSSPELDSAVRPPNVWDWQRWEEYLWLPKLMYRAAVRIHNLHRAVTLKRSALPVSGIGPLIAIHRGLYMGEAMTKPTQSQTSLCTAKRSARLILRIRAYTRSIS